jgi:hypothetical protein
MLTPSSLRGGETLGPPPLNLLDDARPLCYDAAMDRLRRDLLLTGLAGLLLAALLASTAAWLVTSGTLKPPLSSPIFSWMFAVVFGAFSVLEIPLMVFAMRRLELERRPQPGSAGQGNRPAVLGLNALYVLFAAVYALPVMLFTGSLSWGLALCSLAVVRLAASFFFVGRVGP